MRKASMAPTTFGVGAAIARGFGSIGGVHLDSAQLLELEKKYSQKNNK